MSWYKFRDGMLTRETIVIDVARDSWDLMGLYFYLWPIDTDHDPQELGSLVKVAFSDWRGDRVLMNPKEVFFRLTRVDFGWGRYFNYRPGKLVGYAKDGDQPIISCTLIKLDSCDVYTWEVETDKMNIERRELKDFCDQILAMNGMFMGREQYPVLFE